MTVVELQQLRDTAADLGGFGPAIQQVINGLVDIVDTIDDPEHTSTALSVLAGGTNGNPDVLGLLTQVVLTLGDPSANPALRQLTPARAREIRALTREFAAAMELIAPRSSINEAAGAADPRCPHPTDH